MEIRWHGRAGQGIITVSRLLGYSALLEGKYVQAFPQFGPERIGAPMSGFTRISEEPIEIHSAINSPDVVIVLDDSVTKIMDVTAGLKANGKLVVNSDRGPEEFKKGLTSTNKVLTVDATRISLDLLGNTRAFNMAMLGALLKTEPVVSLDALSRAIRERFHGEAAEKNIQVLLKANSEAREA